MLLLTGASGFLGKIAFRVFSSKTNTVGLCHTNDYNGTFIPVELTERDSVFNVLNNLSPDIVVHSAACREPDLCEVKPDYTEKINVNAAKYITDWCDKNNVPLIYISTDYVFDGLNPPYNEKDAVNPVNIYGKTKAVGESIVRQYPNHIIIRIPLQYGYSEPGEDSLILKIIDNLKVGGQIEINNTQFRYPTLSDDVAFAILALIEKSFSGTIHMSGPSRLTRYDIWKEVASVFDLTAAEIIPTSTAVKQTAARPADSMLSTDLYDSLGLYPFHKFHDGLLHMKKLM